jgi:hypothetical protein
MAELEVARLLELAAGREFWGSGRARWAILS